MLSWRAFAASAVLIAATITSSHAAPGNELRVPLQISGLPAGINLVTLNCYIVEGTDRIVAGGNAQEIVSGGSYAGTLAVPLAINRSVSDPGGPATGYWCRVVLSGVTPAGAQVTFWNSTALTASGWRNMVWPGSTLTYMPAARGATHAMEVRGTLTPAQANMIAPVTVTACPCGCGATSGSPTSCSPSTAGIVSGATVAAPPGMVRTPSGGLRPAIRASDAAPPPPSVVQITTPTFRFTGTGVFTNR